jgi:phosphatidylglycerol:prolipoprotein diacylglycerol transferase
MLTFPNIDPVALAIGPLVIRWYALAYVAGIVLGNIYVAWLNRKHSFFSKAALDDLILYAVLGVILGGRIGYVVFYNLPYFLDHPAGILQVWQGGMSFHGGLSGVLISFYLFARKHKISYLRVLDFLAAATPIGLFFGRLANFVNGELYGRVTTSSLGMVFPNGGPEPRYPSQLFEAALEGAVLFVILFLLATRTRALHYRGIIGGAFIAGYGVFRFFIEYFREPDAQLGLLALGFSMGQWLCMPMIGLGIWLLLTAKKRDM